MTDKPVETWEERRAREKSEATAATRALFDYAGRIVHELGGDVWELMTGSESDVDFEHRRPHIRRKTDGANFDIGSAYHAKGRIYVSGNWPKDSTGTEQRPYFSQYSDCGTEAPSITFARTKTAAQAARDIERRFLPAFLPLWEKQAAAVTRLNNSREQRKELAHAIADILDGKVRGPRDDRDSTPYTVTTYRHEHGITNVEFDHDGQDISIKVRCTLDELKQIAALFPPAD